MFKKTIIAATALVASVVAFQPVEKAEARVNVGIGIGVPGYYGGYAPGYYSPGYYGGGYYAPRPRYYAPRRGRISCRRARRIVRNHGYYRVRAIDCSGSRYTFHAKRGGIWYRLRMKSRSGRIYKVTYL